MIHFWEFRDFLDESDRNVIREWISGIPKDARQRLVWQLRNLESTPPPLERKHGIGKLERECAGLLELIFEVDNVQYRPLCCYGPGRRVITLLLGAQKKSRGKRNRNDFDPHNACELALRRKNIVLSYPDRTTTHDYTTTPTNH